FPNGKKPLDILRRDLLERAVSPAVVRAAHHQPVAILGLLQTLGSHRLVILENRCDWSRRFGRLGRLGRRLLCGNRAGNQDQCGYSNDGHETSSHMEGERTTKGTIKITKR